MERRLMKRGDYVAEVSFDSEDGLFRARVVNLERDSFDFCASSIGELPLGVRAVGGGWEVDGEVTAVLHTDPVDSPIRAVRASILAEESDG